MWGDGGEAVVVVYKERRNETKSRNSQTAKARVCHVLPKVLLIRSESGRWLGDDALEAGWVLYSMKGYAKAEVL